MTGGFRVGCQGMRNLSWNQIAFAVLLCSGLKAVACSSPGPHTNEQLVSEAETIVIARAVSGTLEHFGNPNWPSVEMMQFHDHLGPGPQVTFEVIRTLKGPAPTARFTLVGSLRYFGPNKESAPYKLARPGAQTGMCFAYDYKLGGAFLLLLKGGTPYWSEVRPTNEEIRGERDRWLRWVEARLESRAKT